MNKNKLIFVVSMTVALSSITACGGKKKTTTNVTSSSLSSVTSTTSTTSTTSNIPPQETNSIKVAYEACEKLANKATSVDKYSMTGIVTSKIGNSFFIQNGEYGMYCYNSSSLGDIKLGDNLTIEGNVKNYNGCIESVNNEIIESLGQEDIPEPIAIKSLAELNGVKQNVLINTMVTVSDTLYAWSASATSNTAVSYSDGNSIASFQKYSYSEDKGTMYSSIACAKVCFQNVISTTYDKDGNTATNQFFVTQSTLFNKCDSNGYSSNDTNHWTYNDKLQSVGEEEHTYGSEPTSKVDATYDQDGSKTYTCSVCNHQKVEVVTKLEHKYSSTYSFSETNHWRECTDSGYGDLMIDNNTHTFKDEVVTEATCENVGTLRKTCEICGYYYDEDIPARTEHVYEYTHTYKTHNQCCKYCGKFIGTGDQEHTFDDNFTTLESTCSVCGYKCPIVSITTTTTVYTGEAIDYSSYSVQINENSHLICPESYYFGGNYYGSLDQSKVVTDEAGTILEVGAYLKTEDNLYDPYGYEIDTNGSLHGVRLFINGELAIASSGLNGTGGRWYKLYSTNHVEVLSRS